MTHAKSIGGFWALTAAAGALLPGLATAQPAPVFTWTGLYVGANVGFAWNDNDVRAAPFAFGPTRFSQTVGGFYGGVNAGYNWQFGSLITGVELDAGLVSASKRSQFDAFVFPAVGTYSSNLDGIATARLRIGVPLDRALIYVTGGIATANVGTRHFATGFTTFDFRQSGWRFGWVAGAGIEYALNQNWSVKLEGLYVGLENRTARFPTTNLGTYQFGFRDSAAIVRTGFNYRF